MPLYDDPILLKIICFVNREQFIVPKCKYLTGQEIKFDRIVQRHRGKGPYGVIILEKS